MLKMTIDNEEVVSDKDITINEEMLSASSSILNNVYPKEWEEDKDYTSRFYYPQDYSKALIQRSYVTQEAEAGTTIQVNGSVTLTDVDTTKNSRVLRLLGQTSQTGTPTPSSPIPVNVVSGDNEILVNGSNFITFKNISEVTRNGVTTTPNNSELKLNGTVTQATSIFSSQSLDLMLPKGTYTMTYKIASGSVTRPTGDVAFYLRDGATNISTITLAQILGHNNTFSQTFTIDSNAPLYFYSYSNVGNIVFNNTVLQIQLSKGTTATNFEQYIGNTYNIDLPVENLFDKNGNLMLDYRLTSDGGNYGDIGYYISEYIPISANTTYTKNSPTADYAHRVCFFSNNDTTSFISKSEDNTFTTPSNAKYLRFCGLQTEIDTTQLEVGSKQNNFTPYGTTPIELCKIGNYQDYIYKENDKWYLHKEIVSFVFNGTENWSGYVDVSGSSGTIAQIGYNPGILFKNRDGLSSRFEVIANYGATEHIVMAGSLRIIYVQIAKSRLSEDSLNGFKNWLSNNNTFFYGVLDTPTNTEITYAELLNQLNVLSSQ